MSTFAGLNQFWIMSKGFGSNRPEAHLAQIGLQSARFSVLA